MKAALLIVLGYFLASLLAAALLLALQPPHAHFPVLVALAFFPLYPLQWVGKLFEGRATPVEAMALALFVLLMGTSVYLALKARRRTTQ
jgi:hypothetical protein